MTTTNRFSLTPRIAPEGLTSHRTTRVTRVASFGFTLVELLTVIAIIGILAAIIIPTVGKVRSSARKSQCLSNMRQWGNAIRLFSNDFKGYVACYNNLGSSSGAYDPKIYSPYFSAVNMLDPVTGVKMSSQEAMSRCPAMEANAGEPDYVRRCYGFSRPYDFTTNKSVYENLNGSVFNQDPAITVPGYRLNQLQNPSRYVMMFELAPLGTGADTGTVVVDKPTDLESKVRGMQTGKAVSGTVTPRHGGLANLLYADGHVQSVSASETDYANGSASVKATIENWFRK